MKKIFSALCTLCISSTALANLHPEPGQFGIQAEFLFLQPRINVLQFAVESTPTEAKILYNDPDYSPAYRVEGIYGIDCRYNLHARFTYFNSGNDRRSVTSTFQLPVFFTGTVEDNIKFRYYSVDTVLGAWIANSCNFDLEVGIGIVYSNIKLAENTIAFVPVGPPQTNTVNSTFWGVGPELTVDFEYPLPLCFCGTLAIVADMRGALLQSKTEDTTVIGGLAAVNLMRDSFIVADGATTFTITNEPFHGIVPAADAKLGLNWTYQWSSFSMDLELGYEWIYYHRALGINNISFQGPYLALGAAF